MRNGLLIFLALCATVMIGAASPGTEARAASGSLDAEFEAAAEEYGVPKDLLKAMGHVNTRWESPPPGASDYERGDLEGRGSYGIMALVRNPSRDTLGRAARLTGLPEGELKSERAANVLGGAAVLSEIQGGEKPAGINGWYGAVVRYGGGALYAEQVYKTLKGGASATISTGERVELSAHPEAKVRGLYTAQASGDYPGSTWYGAHTNNYTAANRPSSHKIDRIVIHVTQGSWSSAINWFKDSRANVSAHYTVRSSDGFVGQSVREKDIAYHAGNWTYNQTSIGIEHEGYVSESRWFTDAMYRSSAKLSAYLAKKHGIPMDRQHIVGHNQVPGATHTDPGRYWNWDKYISYVRQYAGATQAPSPAAYTQVVDNANPDRFGVSSNWSHNSWNAQRYNSDYRAAAPKAISDSAAYRFNVPSGGNYAVYAWWPASSGYNTSTPVGVKTSAGWKWLRVDQTQNGGKWVYLGTFGMSAGDESKVKVSRWTTTKGYVIADAMKIVKK